MNCFLFGEMRALLGNKDSLAVHIAEGVPLTVPLVWAAVQEAVKSESSSFDTQRQRQIQDVLSVSLFAVDDEFVDVADISAPVAVRSQLAIIPPVSGG